MSTDYRKCKALLLTVIEGSKAASASLIPPAPPVPPNLVWRCDVEQQYVCTNSGLCVPVRPESTACCLCGKIYANCTYCYTVTPHAGHGEADADYHARCHICRAYIMLCMDCMYKQSKVDIDMASHYECYYCGDTFCDAHLNDYQCQRATNSPPCKNVIRVCTADIESRPRLCSTCKIDAELGN